MKFIKAAVLAILVGLLVIIAATSAQSTNSTDQYAVVFDAGSSGTRVHVYRFSGSGDNLKLEEEIYDPVLSATKPGLSSYASDAQAAADSLVPMLNWALSVIPQELQATTPVMLGATAGLRLLPEEQSSAILNDVGPQGFTLESCLFL
jgi:apyrase